MTGPQKTGARKRRVLFFGESKRFLMQVSVLLRGPRVYAEGGKTEKDARDNVRSFLLHFSTASSLGDMYRNCMLFIGVCVVS